MLLEKRECITFCVAQILFFNAGLWGEDLELGSRLRYIDSDGANRKILDLGVLTKGGDLSLF
jgi:hypothetical protein